MDTAYIKPELAYIEPGLLNGQGSHMARAPMKFDIVLTKHLWKTCCHFTVHTVHEVYIVHEARAPIWPGLTYGQGLHVARAPMWLIIVLIMSARY